MFKKEGVIIFKKAILTSFKNAPHNPHFIVCNDPIGYDPGFGLIGRTLKIIPTIKIKEIPKIKRHKDKVTPTIKAFRNIF